MKKQRDIYIQAFADDKTLLITLKLRKKLEDHAYDILETVHLWDIRQSLIFNPEKSKFLWADQDYANRPANFKTINNSLKATKELKILWVIFNSKFTFTPYLKYIKEQYKHSRII